MISGRLRARWIELALPAGAFLLTLVVFLPFARIGVDPHHDGVMLKPALDVHSGQHLFRDTFTQYGPLTTYLQVAFLAAFGKSLYALKLGTVLCYAVASALLVAAWRRLLPASLTVFSYLFWLTLAPFYEPDWALLPWSSVYALAFQSASFYLLLRSWRSERPGLLATACGASAGLVFWCRIPVGVFLTASLTAAFAMQGLARRGRPGRWVVLGLFAGGGLAIHLAFVALLGATGSLGDWYFQNLQWPALWVSKFSSDVTTVLPGVAGKLASSLFVLRYFYALIMTTAGIDHNVGVLLLLLASAVIILTILAVESAQPRRASLLRLMLSSRLAPPILLFGGLAAFLWLTTPPIGPRPPRVFAWRLSRLYPWAFAVPAWVLAATAVQVFRRPWRDEAEGEQGRGGGLPMAGVLAGLVALASWLQYYPIADPRHIFWAISPGLGVFVFHAWRWCRTRPRVIVVALSALALPLGMERFEAAREKLARPYVRIHGRSVLRGMRVPEKEAARWASLLDSLGRYVRENREVAMQIEGGDALYATLVPDLTNATPFFLDWAQIPVGDDVSERRKRFIAERRPLIFVSATNLPRVPSLIDEFDYSPLLKLEGTGDVILRPNEGPKDPAATVSAATAARPVARE